MTSARTGTRGCLQALRRPVRARPGPCRSRRRVQRRRERDDRPARELLSRFEHRLPRRRRRLVLSRGHQSRGRRIESLVQHPAARRFVRRLLLLRMDVRHVDVHTGRLAHVRSVLVRLYVRGRRRSDVARRVTQLQHAHSGRGERRLLLSMKPPSEEPHGGEVHSARPSPSPYRRSGATRTIPEGRSWGHALILALVFLVLLLLASRDAPTSAPLGEMRHALIGW